MALPRPLTERIVAFAAKLDLGRKPYSPGDCCAGSIGGVSASASKVYYPTIWIDGQPKAIDLPKAGKAIVDYKVVSRSSNERDGVTKHDASIEIQTLEPMEEEKKTPGSAKAVKLSSLAPGMITLARGSRLLRETGMIANTRWGSVQHIQADMLKASRLKKKGAPGPLGKIYDGLYKSRPTTSNVEEATRKGIKVPRLLSALTPGMIQFERPRNTDGEFAPQAEGAPDPATMRAAYGPPVGAANNKSGAAKAAAGAAVGLGGTAAAALLLARKRRGRIG